MVEYDRKTLSIDDIPNGRYFIRKTTHDIMHIGPLIPKEDLQKAISLRGWNESEVVVENGDMPYIKIEENL